MISVFILLSLHYHNTYIFPMIDTVVRFFHTSKMYNILFVSHLFFQIYIHFTFIYLTTLCTYVNISFSSPLVDVFFFFQIHLLFRCKIWKQHFFAFASCLFFLFFLLFSNHQKKHVETENISINFKNGCALKQ